MRTWQPVTIPCVVDSLDRIEAEENERARDDAKKALAYWRETKDKNIRQLWMLVYGVDPRREPSRFHSTGSVKRAALLGRPIVTVYPFASLGDFKDFYGATPEEMAVLERKGIIIALSQPVSRFRSLDYCKALVLGRPKDYFKRANYFYSVFFDDTVDLVPVGDDEFAPSVAELYIRGREDGLLERALTESLAHTRESYLKKRVESLQVHEERIRDSMAYRYASVACFVGEENVQRILAALPVKESLQVLLHLHIVFDHYLARGMLVEAHENRVSSLWGEYSAADSLGARLSGALDSSTVVLGENENVAFLLAPSLDQIISVHSDRVPGYFPKPDAQLVSRETANEMRTILRKGLRETEDSMRRVAGKERLTRFCVTFAVTAISSGVFLANQFAGGLAAILGGSLVAPEFSQMIVGAAAKRVASRGIKGAIAAAVSVWSRPAPQQPKE